MMPSRAAAWLAFYTIAIADIALVFVILLILQPYLYDLNALLGSVTGVRINYMLLFGILAGLFIAWFAFLIARCRRQLSRNASCFKPGRAEVAISIPILVAWNAFYVILGDAAGGEIFIVLRFFEGISFYFYIMLNGIMILCLFKAVPAIVRFAKGFNLFPRKRRSASILVASAIVAGYAVCFALPFAATPTTISSDPLPPKPLLIGHRGASNYAPENTIVAAQAALQFNVAGWEVDVQVSYDGVFFLMHDDDLRRTTDVETLYPNLASVPACDFNISQIQALDAGSWFADDDPYGTILSGVVPRSQAESYRGVKVPMLQEAINFSEIHGLILDVDFKSPLHGHPFHDTARSAMITMLNASTLGKKAWVYTKSALAENLSRLCTMSCSVESVIANGFDGVNLGLEVTNAQLAAFYAHGIPTVVYTVDSVQIYSTLWTLGVTYVKTNRPWLFTGLDQPVPRMDHAQYAAFWLVFFAAGGGSVVICLYLRKKGSRVSS
jgi:glycerophosphoryl diester phosphodiesterase